jgi:hypothetical protein
MRNAYKILVRTPQGKRPHGRPRPKWEDNIKVNLNETGSDCVDLVPLGRDGVQWRADF